MSTKTILTGNVITSDPFSVVSKTRLKCLQSMYPSLSIETGSFPSCSCTSGFQHRASRVSVYIYA